MARKIQPRSNVPKPKRGQSSEDYWRERESRQRAENIRNEAKTAERINRIFQGMQDSIQQEIEAFYQRYASKEGITLTEARGRVSRIDMEQYERLAKKYVEAAHHGDEELAFSQEANDQMRLYNAAMRINRLEMLKARCGIRAMEGYRDTERLINENLEERAYSEYRRLAGILGNSVQFNENMVRAIVNASYQNATWSQRLWNHQASLSSQIGTQLASGILAGKSSTVLAREIQKLTGGSTYACQRLMRTELRRVQTEAALHSMTDNGVTEYKFMVENGVNPCDECLALDGQVFKLSDMNVGKNAPPMHPQCVLPGTKIIAPGMEAIMRSEYSGDVVEIGTASGTRLSVTPNHIVLTERGWIRAKNIVKGDKVIHYAGRGEHGVEVHPANDDCIPAVEELFTAFIKAGGVSALGVPASPVDFKGDVVPQSKVDVVFINSQLRDEVDASVSKHGGYGPFVRALVIGERGLDAESPLNKALIWYGLAADGIMSRLSERGIFLGSSIRCADLVRFRTTADYNARLLQVSADNGSTDVVSIGKSIFTNSGLVIGNDNLEDVGGQFNGGVRRNSELNSVLNQDALNCFGSFMDDVCNVTKVFAGIVQFDDVVDVTSRFYSGHVYDTSCMSTLYIANGIITSNCHCASAPYVDEAKWQKWLDGPAQSGVPWNEFNPDISDQTKLLQKYGSLENMMFHGSNEDLKRWSELSKQTGLGEKDILRELAKKADNWEQLMNMQSESKLKSWADELRKIASPAELGAVRMWSGETYSDINQLMRFGTNKGSAVAKAAENLYNLLNRMTTKEDIYVRRGTGIRHILDGMPSGWRNDLSLLNGKEFKDAGFTATSPSSNGGFSGCGENNAELFIRVPKGTHGAYIGEVARAKNEKEFLLQKGYKYRIVKAERRPNKYFPEQTDLKIWVEVVLGE